MMRSPTGSRGFRVLRYRLRLGRPDQTVPRDQAKEVRQMAAGTIDPYVREQLLNIGDDRR